MTTTETTQPAATYALTNVFGKKLWLVSDQVGQGLAVAFTEAGAKTVADALNQSAGVDAVYDALKLWINTARFLTPNDPEYDQAVTIARAALAQLEQLRRT